ncbi:Undecaprenyl-phosphate 4-deoxy-4-formamido-L-arabinose transferase [Terrabacter sp. BE26]
MDGLSSDDTVATAQRVMPSIRVVRQSRRGKGNALACGFNAAGGDVIVMFDADGSADPQEIPRFVDALVAGADFAKGSRRLLGGGSQDITHFRSVGNRTLSSLANALLGTSYTDLCYGYNAFWRDILGELDLPPVDLQDAKLRKPLYNRMVWGDGFEIETLLNCRVATAQLQVTEVPSVEKDRIHGVSNLNSFSDGIRVLRTIFVERRRRGGRSFRRLLGQPEGGHVGLRPVNSLKDTRLRTEEFTPVELTEVEITGRLPALAPAPRRQRRRAQVLVRLATEPLGFQELTVGESGLGPDELGHQILERFGAQVGERLTAAGYPVTSELAAEGLGIDPATMPNVQSREKLLASAPLFSIVISTRDRAEQLASCLKNLGAQEYPDFEVVVVDNASTTDAAEAVVADAPLGCTYVRENRPGLSWARNAGARAARGDLIAFLDDDEVADRYWLAELLRAFSSGRDIGCVSGMILPAALETQAQEWFEQYGGHSKGRGFSPVVFSAHGGQSPVYPLPPFGAGGNMAFRREVLLAIGGFDVALGAGTPARGSEDTYAFSRVLLSGFRMAYQPSAFVRHHHYADLSGLTRQLRGYGTGVTAYYAALLRHDPKLLGTLVTLIPSAVRDMRGSDSLSSATTRDFPPRLRREVRMGMLTGVPAYVRSARAQARLSSGAIP